MPVVHAIAATLRIDADPAAVDRAVATAEELRSAPAIQAVHVGRSASRLVTAVWLPEPSALEPFAASTAHMSFVMRGLAPVVAGMWSVSVATPRDAPATDPAAIWAFAIPETEGVFEWQIRRQLESIEALPGDAWVGPTVEERERYRAGGVVLLDAASIASFEEALPDARIESLNLEAALAPCAGAGASS
jgi:hypothetical protein